jgi:hypothetical protein
LRELAAVVLSLPRFSRCRRKRLNDPAPIEIAGLAFPVMLDCASRKEAGYKRLYRQHAAIGTLSILAGGAFGQGGISLAPTRPPLLLAAVEIQRVDDHGDCTFFLSRLPARSARGLASGENRRGRGRDHAAVVGGNRIGRSARAVVATDLRMQIHRVHLDADKSHGGAAGSADRTVQDDVGR